jgi:hypothetical protein
MSGPIPAGELTDMRTTVNGTFDLSCQIQRKAPSRTAEGDVVDNYSTLYTVACNLTQPPVAMMQIYSSVIGAFETWLVRFAWNQDVLRDDQLIIGGLALRVQIVLNPQSYSADTRVLAGKVM